MMGMSPRRIYALSTHISSILNDLESSGIRIEIGDDFARYLKLRGQRPERSPIYPMFDTERSFVDKTTGFWVCGFNASDELIHTQAVRMYELPDNSLASHLRVHRHKYITPDTTPDPDLTFFSGPEVLQDITGRVCYQGDFWLHATGLGGPRGKGATPLLSRLLLEVMVGAWDPDFVFALVPKQLAAKGAHLRYCYNHCELGQWIGPDGQITEEEYLIWMGSGDLGSLVGKAPKSLRHSSKPSATQQKGFPNGSANAVPTRAVV